MKVRTRYAPSPTGYFHIGGARTALFNYLYAKNHNGDFICRIEDTDIERNVDNGIESQLDNLDWLKISPDESLRKPVKKYQPYIQSSKLERYKKLAYELVENDKAYFCFCSKEELERDRDLALKEGRTPKYNRRCFNLTKKEIKEKIDQKIPFVIRLKMEDNVDIEWDDLIRGKMVVPTSALTDPVILKSNNYPMYNFAVVVDDYDMDITHVLRGEEHLSNTPYQIAIKKALGFDSKEIKYGHLSIIVDETGKKLSKRNKLLKQFIDDYNQMGFVPEALTNFLTLLGWAPKKNKEILTTEEIINQFDGSRISKAPAFFDFNKLLWINNTYIKAMSDDQYLSFVKPFVTFNLKEYKDKSDLLLLIFKNQINYAAQINDLLNDVFGIEENEKIKIIQTNVVNPSFMKNINQLEKILNNIDQITLENASSIINEVKSITSLKGKELFMPIRIATTFKEHGPELNKVLYIIGKKQILENIAKIHEYEKN